MGMIVPPEGELHRLVLELKGRKNLTQEQYKAYKAAIERVVMEYGAEIRAAEYVVIEKKKKTAARKK
jgi:hypothetical protein